MSAAQKAPAEHAREILTRLAARPTETWTESDMIDALFDLADALNVGLSATEGDDE